MIEKVLYNAVRNLVEVRYPIDWGGAAAVCVEDGTIYTSVAPEIINDSTALCMETGSFRVCMECYVYFFSTNFNICIYLSKNYLRALVQEGFNAFFVEVLYKQKSNGKGDFIGN